MQCTLFDDIPIFKIDKPVRLIELFAGIGSQVKAMQLLQKFYGIEFESWRICENDKKAVNSYNAIHSTNFTKQDIQDITADDLGMIDTDKYCYIMTYSFPCQDISGAGLKKGMAKGDGTRSGLLWEVERLLRELVESGDSEANIVKQWRTVGQASRLPQVLVMENVPEIRSKQNLPHFTKWIQFLESLGYSNYVQVLNAKDYGIPQNRERCFMVSILGNYRYEFPKPKKLNLRLRDLLEQGVADKYYITNAKINSILTSKFTIRRINQIQDGDLSDTLLAHDAKDVRCVVVGELEQAKKQFSLCRKVYSGSGLSPTLLAQGNSTITKIVDKCIIAGHLDNGKQLEMHNRVFDTNGLSPALLTQTGGNIEKKILVPESGDSEANIDKQWRTMGQASRLSGRVRKLTPREYWRLMGFEDSDFDKVADIKRAGKKQLVKTGKDGQCVQAQPAKTTLYTQAGNSIVVSVLTAIFGALYGIDTADIQYKNIQGECRYGI